MLRVFSAPWWKPSASGPATSSIASWREGIPVEGIIGLGGVAKKSPYVMQTLANVLNRPIQIARSEQTCALGAAMFAAVAGGYSRRCTGGGFRDG